MPVVTLQEPFRALFYAPFYAALARGDYAAQGVEVRLLPGAAPSLAKDSVLDGTADLAWAGRCGCCWPMTRTRPARCGCSARW